MIIFIIGWIAGILTMIGVVLLIPSKEEAGMYNNTYKDKSE